MKHLAPFQLKDGRWRYGIGGGGPIGYCRDHEDEGHATADEACECYRRYLVDRAMERIADAPSYADDGKAHQLHRCEAPGCTALLTSGFMLAMWADAVLCVDHRTRADVERALGPVGESWES